MRSAETYPQRLARLSRLHYLNDESDFRLMSFEEFESWKGERGLSEADQYTYRVRRAELKRVCESYVVAYKSGLVALTGKKGILAALRRVCGPSDSALFGRVLWEALGESGKKKRGPSSNRAWLAGQLRFYLGLLSKERPGRPYLGFPSSTSVGGKKVVYPGSSYEDRLALVCARYHKLGLQDLVPSVDAIRELVRRPRPSKRI